MPQREERTSGTEAVPHICAAFKRSQSCTRTSLFLHLLLFVLLLAAIPCKVVAQSASSSAITGRLLGGDHKAIAGASIHVSGASSQQTTSDANGDFQLRALPAGRYQVTATTAGGSATSDWIELAPGKSVHVELRLGLRPSAASTESGALQFADDPHFTIAGITDWTAAGGHGSDASLRTSETLTRETLSLQPGVTPGSCSQDESTLQSAVAAQPQSFEARHCLGMFDLRNSKYTDAVSNLKAAYLLRPADNENEYALARACEKAGDSASAHNHLQSVAARGNAGDLHRLAGQFDEATGDPIAAVDEFARAVRQDPSEQNYFAWGSELLYHRAVLQARDVFAQGVRAWPKSARMHTALGTSLFAAALYDDAAKALCQAAALDPANPNPYLFMGQIEVVAPTPLPCIAQKLADFHQREPGNALADYYYAMALWKQQPPSAESTTQHQVLALLNDAVKADSRCGEAWLQLGNLKARSGDYSGAIPLYTKAVDARPQLTDAWYRLGTAYDRTGQHDKARDAFNHHDQLEKQQADEVDKQRREIKQFVISSAGSVEASEPRNN